MKIMKCQILEGQWYEIIPIGNEHMRLGATKLTFEQLHEALDLSDDVHIDDIFMNEGDRYFRTVHVVLSGLNQVIPEHQPGSQLATNPLYHFQSIEPIYSPSYYGGIGGGVGFFSGLRRYI